MKTLTSYLTDLNIEITLAKGYAKLLFDGNITTPKRLAKLIQRDVKSLDSFISEQDNKLKIIQKIQGKCNTTQPIEKNMLDLQELKDSIEECNRMQALLTRQCQSTDQIVQDMNYKLLKELIDVRESLQSTEYLTHDMKSNQESLSEENVQLKERLKSQEQVIKEHGKKLLSANLTIQELSNKLQRAIEENATLKEKMQKNVVCVSIFDDV